MLQLAFFTYPKNPFYTFSYKYNKRLFYSQAMLHLNHTFYPKYEYYPIIIQHPFFL